MITIQEVVNYIIHNRRGKAFKNYTLQMIENCILEAMADNTLIVSHWNGRINGIGLAIIESEGLLHVNQILTTDKTAFPSIIKHFATLFPGYKLKAERRGKIVYYKTNRFISKILKRKMI